MQNQACSSKKKDRVEMSHLRHHFDPKNDIALALASSGIAATLLLGEKTAHSTLKLPLNMLSTETPPYNISKSSGMGKVVQQCKLIVWNEVDNGTQEIGRGS